MSAPDVRGLNVAPPPPERVHLRDRLLTLDQLGALPPVQPLIAGLLCRNTTAQLAGPPGSYKSFAAIGMACSLAVGRPFEGHHVPRPGLVVYVAAEGASGLHARIHAWCELTNVDPANVTANLLVLPAPIQLGNAVDVSEAVDVARERDAALLILDTRARCTLGMAENDATDQGLAIDAAERIREAAGCTVLVIHHSGRSGDHGRGSNAWDGAVWSDLRLKGEDLRCVIHCDKHKDWPDGCDHHFRLIPHTVGPHVTKQLPDETDEQWLSRRSTLVFVQNGDLDDLAGDRRSTRTVLDIVRTSAGEEGLTRAQIASIAEERGIGRSTAYAAVSTLVKVAGLRNIGTERRCKYVLAGQSPLIGGE